MKVKIHVTKEILERSKMCGHQEGSVGKNCAIALALRDLIPDAYVSRSNILIGGDSMHLSEEVSCFIDLFDFSLPKDRLNMPEVSFEINIPDSFIEKIGISEAKEIIEKSKTIELV